MSVSAIYGTRIAAVPVPVRLPASVAGGATRINVAQRIGSGGVGLVIECSSRPQKKATAHHRKTRPRKTQPWDIRRRGPTVYPPLPPLPPEWTLVTEAGDDASSAPPSSPSPQSQ